jgi:hypothetical protein
MTKKTDEVKPNGKVHPVAELFPMMSEQELDDLAASIKSAGLLNPIVLDTDGTLIDGRNREEACKRAKIVPKYTVLDGEDVETFIFAKNASRRHMMKGQLAMAVVKAHELSSPGLLKEESRSGKRSGLKAQLAHKVGVGRDLISDAVLVLEYASELIDSVIAGPTSLKDAHKEAEDREAAANSAEEQMKVLRAEANDLADLVAEERMKLSEALGVMRQRKQKAKEEVESTTRQFSQCIGFLSPRAYTIEQYIEYICDHVDLRITSEDASFENLDSCLKVCSGVIKNLKARIHVSEKRN